ncbi:uncharacterized protein J3D65DRAFT_626975 [Phyllosticta citribraziliensis]|uniref:Uncharacterized protein n=1 Tax=Phyllosticta citribraziliensis TaxID=989973 RepID=A0ABR1LLA2_9PEZI
MLGSSRVLLSSRAMSPLSARAQVPECSSAMHCMSFHHARTRKSLSHFLVVVRLPIPNLPHSFLVQRGPCPTCQPCLFLCFVFPAALLRIPRPTSTSPHLLVVGRALRCVQRKPTSAHLHPDSCRIGLNRSYPMPATRHLSDPRGSRTNARERAKRRGKCGGASEDMIQCPSSSPAFVLFALALASAGHMPPRTLAWACLVPWPLVVCYSNRSSWVVRAARGS